MALVPHIFKRVVLGIHPSAPDRNMQLAVELAELLHLDLMGLFLEDTSLHNLASIPFAREFRPLGGGWHPLDLDRLSRDLELAAHSTERLFTEAARRLATKCLFEVIRGPTAETIASISRTGDIVMVVEPVSPAERVTQQFSWLIEAAFRSAAAVMLVPTHIARTTGPVVAIAAVSDDPSIRAAATIAVAAEEDLVIVEATEGAADDSLVRNLAVDTGLAIKRVAGGEILLSNPVRAQAFRHLQERLIVMTRGVLANDVALSIASSRRVPVLVVEPLDASRNEGG